MTVAITCLSGNDYVILFYFVTSDSVDSFYMKILTNITKIIVKYIKNIFLFI